MSSERKLDRRAMLRYVSGVGIVAVAGCSGSDGNSKGESDGNNENQGGQAGTLGEWSLDVNSPEPVTDRITGDEWTAPEYDESEVADQITHFNLGGMENDPATSMWHDYFENETGISMDFIEVSSQDAIAQYQTVLSAGETEPVGFQVSQEFFMDLAVNGWFEPADIIWPDEAFEPFPSFFGDAAVTDIDKSLDGEHIYVTPAISEAHAMNYNPDLLEELGFERDFYDNPTWSEIREVSEEADSHSGDFYGYVWYGRGERYPVYPWLMQTWSYGGDLVQDDGTVVFNSEEGVRALEWQRKMIDDGLVPDVQQYGEGGPQDLFLGEGVIGFTGGTDMMGLAFEEWGEDTSRYAMGIPPQGENGESVTYMNTDFFVTNRASPDDKKRASLIYMDSERSAVAEAEEFVQEGNFPANAQTWEHSKLQDHRFGDVAQKVAQNARASMWPSQMQTFDAVVSNLQQCWLGQKDPQTALDDAQEEIDRILEQN